mgnify:CR=1 FL=1
MWIEPSGFEEIHSRGNDESHRLSDPSKWVPYGVGAIEGRVREGARPELPVMASPATGPAAYDLTAYGPGEEPRPRDGEPTAVVHGELL